MFKNHIFLLRLYVRSILRGVRINLVKSNVTKHTKFLKSFLRSLSLKVRTCSNALWYRLVGLFEVLFDVVGGLASRSKFQVLRFKPPLGSGASDSFLRGVVGLSFYDLHIKGDHEQIRPTPCNPIFWAGSETSNHV